ncbi:MAG: hypothetical protein JNK74_18120 [Candidatus Hydrogenedentes bacterium]|nr:hypothetical protein [Candidatus Hydrogenedentota bacterium]
MNTPLNDDTQQKARELARKITVAHDLDPEIQEELYGHIEDKLLAYKSGEELVSDEDAFILVREHFGDAKVIRGLLRGVHAGAFQASLMRKVLALTLVACSVRVGFSLARELSIAAAGLYESGAGVLFCILSSLLIFEITALGTLAFVLRRWKQAERSERELWFVRWSLPRMTSWLIVAVAMSWLIPAVSISVSIDELGFEPSRTSLGLMASTMICTQMLWCAIWFWWADSGSRTLTKNVVIGLSWAAYSLLGSMYPAKVLLHLGEGGPLDETIAHVGHVPLSVSTSFVGTWFTMSSMSPSIPVIAGCLFVTSLFSIARHIVATVGKHAPAVR